MFEILGSYTFMVVCTGTLLLAAAASLIGALNVFKHQSLIGDAIGHATFPGVILAFILSQSRNSLILLLGAAFSGALAYYLVQKSRQNSKIPLDAHLAIFLSGFFGLGMVLKSLIQGNKDFVNASQAGLEHYIFGQAAYLLESDVLIIAVVAALILTLILSFYKELKVYLFDPEYALVTGIPIRLVDALILLMTILVIAIGIKAVGAILISSFLIIPTVTALQWSHKLSRVLILATFFAGIAAFLGNLFSSLGNGLATGPTIIMVQGILALVSMFAGRNGYLRRRLLRRSAAL